MSRFRKFKIIFWVVSILWMSMIFYFSHQPANVSKEESGKVLVKMNLLSEDDISSEGDRRVFKLQLFIRKTAHVTVFMVLGILITLSITSSMQNNFMAYIVAYITGTLYGIFDEVHQIFVPGRGPQLRDVALDSVGVVIGVLITALVVEIIRHRSRNISLRV